MLSVSDCQCRAPADGVNNPSVLEGKRKSVVEVSNQVIDVLQTHRNLIQWSVGQLERRLRRTHPNEIRGHTC